MISTSYLVSSALVALVVVAKLSTTHAEDGIVTTMPDDTSTPQNEDDDVTQYPNFLSHNKSQTCTPEGNHERPFNNQIRGVNLGGWLVLEPWITPSLFYQFLGKDENTTAMDMYSFCQVLGPEEGNRQLRNHWDRWVTEDIIQELYDSGAVNSVRLPVGDWMYKPYGPYVGCTDGALGYVDYLLDWCYSRGISVLIDIHGMKDSQNGFDNSGQSLGLRWTSKANTEPAGLVTFEHWPIQTANWIGDFDRQTYTYKSINHDNIAHSLEVIQRIVDLYKSHPAILGLEPINEPWWFTPVDELKNFYWEGYLIVKRDAPYWKYIIHDSFLFDTSHWGGFMKDCPDRALDTHIYQAWSEPASRVQFYNDACGIKSRIAAMENEFGPVIVGEWSLATDNCAMWLNGFNDNVPGFPRLPCKYVDCPTTSYLGPDQPGIPLNPGTGPQGPFGTGMSGPMWGLCPTGRDWPRESSGNAETGTSWMRVSPTAPPRHDATDEVMSALARKKISAFSGIGHGFYFWNFRTDLNEPEWSYMAAVERGWIPKGNLADPDITHACHKEDNGLFLCVAKRDTLEDDTRYGIAYALNYDEIYNQSFIWNLTGEALYEEADAIYSEHWKKYRGEGATCDFGGTAMLIEINKTYIDDDDYFNYEYSGISPEEAMLHLILVLLMGLCVGSVVGFCVAMRTNKKFYRSVSGHHLIRPISHSTLFRASFGGYRHDKTDGENTYLMATPKY